MRLPAIVVSGFLLQYTTSINSVDSSRRFCVILRLVSVLSEGLRGLNPYGFPNLTSFISDLVPDHARGAIGTHNLSESKEPWGFIGEWSKKCEIGCDQLFTKDVLVFLVLSLYQRILCSDRPLEREHGPKRSNGHDSIKRWLWLDNSEVWLGPFSSKLGWGPWNGYV